MSEKRMRVEPQQIVDALKQGILDDRLLHLTDEELREELAVYRRDGAGVADAAERTSWYRGVSAALSELAWHGPPERSLRPVLVGQVLDQVLAAQRVLVDGGPPTIEIADFLPRSHDALAGELKQLLIEGAHLLGEGMIRSVQVGGGVSTELSHERFALGVQLLQHIEAVVVDRVGLRLQQHA